MRVQKVAITMAEIVGRIRFPQAVITSNVDFGGVQALAETIY